MSTAIPFRFELEFEYGVADTVSPLIRRVVARNPSAFTFHGTGTYIVGHGEVAVIDPGPRDEAHVAALMRCLRQETVTHLLVTHTHLDHSPASADLRALTGARTYGFGPHAAGREAAGEQVEEGVDWSFTPDHPLAHGDRLEGPGWTLESVHTPGHTSNHLCYRLREEKALFSGDHVMGWSTTIVSPPDGDMGAYLESLAGLLSADDERYWPTHGPPIDDPKPYVRALLAHRRERERQIVECIERGEDTIPRMVAVMYPHLDRTMHAAAGLQVYSALVRLVACGRVECEGAVGPDSVFRTRSPPGVECT